MVDTVSALIEIKNAECENSNDKVYIGTDSNNGNF